MNAPLIRTTVRPKELIAAVGLALVFWSLLAFLTGLFNGGFLLWDDIILADLHAGLKSTGFLDLYTRTVQKDLNIRFRPLALLHYITMARLHGLNYAALLWHNLVIASLACAFLYGAARNIGTSIGASVLFVAVTCLGNQGVFALRLVLAENPGMLFIAISAWLLTIGKRIPAALFFLLAALTKESFVLLAPAMILADMMLQRNTWKAHLQKHLPFILLVSMASLLILGVIVFRVGTNAIGYAGVDQDSFSPSNFLRALSTVIFVKGFGIAMLTFLVSLLSSPSLTGPEKSKLFMGAALCALVAFPQAFLYTKSGIFMHYLLPAQLWSGLMVLMLWKNPFGIAPRSYMGFKAVTRVLILFNLVLLVRNARDIGTWGREARMAMNMVAEKTSPGDTILIVGHPVRDYEKATDAARFLASDIYQRPNASILPTTMTDTSATDHERKLTQRFLDANRTFIDRRSELFQHASCILFMPGVNDIAGIDGMDTTRVGPYLIATHGHQ